MNSKRFIFINKITLKCVEVGIKHKLIKSSFIKFYKFFFNGDLIARATNDLNSLTTLATGFFQSVVFGFSKIIAATIMMLFINPILTLASVSFMPIAIFYLNRQRKKKRAYYKTHHEIYGEMTSNVLESIEGKHDELVKANGYYSNIYRSQTGNLNR